jgi:hypothetical protein
MGGGGTLRIHTQATMTYSTTDNSGTHIHTHAHTHIFYTHSIGLHNGPRQACAAGRPDIGIPERFITKCDDSVATVWRQCQVSV